MKSTSIKGFALFVFLFGSGAAMGQLVTFNGTGNLPIPPGAPAQTVGITQSPCTVSGIGTLGSCVTIDNVEINLDHTWVGDIGILLIGPGGQVLELSTGNGGPGDDYTNTVFSDQAGDFITTGAPPFTGSFKPEGRVTNLNNPYNNAPALGTHTFANTYNGLNADGVWTLYINDYVAADVGLLISWSITFNQNGAPPVADAGPDVNTCSNQSKTLTASGGSVYQWSTGGTTASIVVSPSITTTYTVTVTNPGCGSDTDEVMVTVLPNPSVSFSAVDPSLCQNGCQQINVTLSGTPPFTLNYVTIATDGSQNAFTQVFNSLSDTFQLCAPPGTPLGSLQVQATALTDSNCTCN